MTNRARIVLIATFVCAHASAAVNTQRPSLRFEKSFGGTGVDVATAVAVDRAGNSYVTGTTTSLDFPVLNAFQPRIGGTPLRISNDQGTTWISPDLPDPVYAVAGSTKQPNILFGGTTKGMIKTSDGGKTWVGLPNAPKYQVNALVVDSVNPDTVYVATNFGTFKTLNGGTSWRQIDSQSYDRNVLVLVSNPARSTTLFRASDTGGRTPSVYRTTDGGDTWVLLANSPLGTFSIAYDPSNADVLYAAAAEYGFHGRCPCAIYKTTDAGETWAKLIDTPVTVSTFTLAASSSAVFVGTDTGVMISRDAGKTWVQTAVTDAADNIVVDPNNPQFVYATADGIRRSTDGGTTWSTSLAIRQLVQCLAIVPGNPSAVFVGAASGQNIFVSKWSDDGKQMLYSTYLGGGYFDIATAIAVDSQGNAYVTGYTYSQDFPITPGALQKKNPGTINAFLAKIGPQGDKLIFSTYLGGSSKDLASAISIDNSGNTYLTGYAESSDFPITAGATQARLQQNCPEIPLIPVQNPPLPILGFGKRFNTGDAFVTKINADATRLVYSTFLGGTCGEQGLGITADSSGNAIVVGVTNSPDFPVTAGAIQSLGGSTSVTGFLAKLTPQGSLTYATFLGGSGAATAEAIALDAQGNIYVTGTTLGFDTIQFGVNRPVYWFNRGFDTPVGFPLVTPGAAYVLKLNPQTWARTYLKYVGSVFSGGKTIAVDSTGRAWIAGTTEYSSQVLDIAPFPAVHPFQASGSSFVAQLSSNGAGLLFSSKVDNANSVAIDVSGNAFVVGSTRRSDFYKSYDLTAELLRIDADVSSSITVEEPQMLIPRAGSTYAFGSVGPGQLMVLTGTGLGPDKEVPAQLTAAGRVATTLGGTTVTFDGIAAPLLSVQSGRIVCVVPFAVGDPNTGDSLMQVKNNDGGTANTIRLDITWPVIAVLALVNADGKVNSIQNPAASGSIVTIYATGFGRTDPVGDDGEVSSSPGTRHVQIRQIGVTINDADAAVTYLGAAPGQLSVITQINVRVPAELPSGQYAAKVGYGGSPFHDFSEIVLNVGTK